MRGATLKDVAAAAGVGICTVSYVLNGTGLNKVGPATQARIREAAARLRYQPNSAARGLKSGKSMLIGVLVSGVNYSFMPELLQGMEEVLAERHYNMLLCTFKDPEEFTARCRILSQKRVDGVIFNAGGIAGLPAILNEYFPRTPWLSCASAPDGTHPAVWVPAAEVGRVGMEYLLEHGHRRIVVFPHFDRYAGMQAALKHYGLDGEETLLLLRADSKDLSMQLAEIMVWRKLPAGRRPTAFFNLGDWEAVHFMKAARQMGLAIPDDLSVLGVNGQMIGEMVTPPLTSVAQPREDQGRRAVILLLDWIASGICPKTLNLPATVVERGSVASL